MKILILSKDFRDGEGVSEYCKSIAEYMVGKGHKAVIVSFDDGSYYSISDKVDVYRVPVPFDGDNLYNWSMVMNNELKRQARIIYDEEDFDLVHCNDWTTVPGGISLSSHMEIPLVTTLHSTENERGFEGEHSEMISEMEWKAGQESDKLFVTNHDTKNSVLFDLDVLEEKVEVIDPYEEGWSRQIIENYENVLKDKQEVLEQ